MADCEWCGTFFERKGSGCCKKRFCKSTCNKAWKRAQRMATTRAKHKPKPCEWCKEVFMPFRTDTRFCTPECGKMAYKQKNRNDPLPVQGIKRDKDRRKCRKNGCLCSKYSQCLTKDFKWKPDPKCINASKYIAGHYKTADQYLTTGRDASILILGR